MLLTRAFADFWFFIAVIAVVTGVSVGLTFRFPEHKFQIRKWLHIVAVGFTAYATNVLSWVFQDLIFEGETYLAFQLVDEFLILILLFAALLWIAVFAGFFNINGRKSWGIAWFPTALFVLLYAVRFLSDHIFLGLYYTSVSFFILAFADGFAALIGYQINSLLKTRLGSFVFLMCCFIIIYISNQFFSLDINIPFSDWKVNLVYSFFGALILTVIEYYSKNGIDNLTVPIAAFLYFAYFKNSDIWLLNTHMQLGVFLAISGAVIVAVFAVYRLKWLSVSGISMALILAFVMIIAGLSLVPILVFFILGTIVGKLKTSSWVNDSQIKFESDKKHGKPRDIIQVLSNAGIPLFLAVLMIFLTGDFFLETTPTFSINPVVFESLIWVVMSAALCDTWSSEWGIRLGGNPVDILGFRKLQKGASGGITLMGTLMGLLGSVVMALVFYFGFSGDVNSAHKIKVLSWMVLGGLIGTVFDSVLGSVFQRKILNENNAYSDDVTSGYSMRYWSNDMVNLVSLVLVVIVFAIAY